MRFALFATLLLVCSLPAAYADEPLLPPLSPAGAQRPQPDRSRQAPRLDLQPRDEPQRRVVNPAPDRNLPAESYRNTPAPAGRLPGTSYAPARRGPVVPSPPHQPYREPGLPPGKNPPHSNSTFGPSAPPDPEMQKLDNEDQKLTSETQELSNQITSAHDDNSKQELRGRLEELVTRHFEIRQARRELHLKRLEDELKRLNALVKKRVELRQQIINRRVSDLLGEPDELGF